MPDHPEVSWLLCTCRNDALLRRAIDSCLQQTLSNFELLLIANGPDAKQIKQQLVERYGSDKRLRVVATPLQRLNFSLSLGLHLARAPLIARMDADDVSMPQRLQCQVDRMRENSALVVLGSNYQRIDGNAEVLSTVALPIGDEEIRRKLPFKNPLCHPSVMLRKEPILAIGGYLGGDNSEDYDLWSRVAMHKEWKFENIDIPLLKYNADPSGQARASRKAYANMAAAQLRNFVVGQGWGWLLGAAFSCMKAVFLSRKE